MNRPAFIVFLCFATIAFFSCKRQRISTADSAATDVGGVIVQEIDFTYFNSRSKVNFTDAENDVTAIVNIRMKKDSIIWLSISKLGIEGARSIITEDSVFVMDKLKHEYTAYDFASLSEKFNFNITFDIFQAAILGNLPISREDRQGKISREKDLYVLRQKEDAVTIDNYISAENMKVKKITMVEQPTNNSLTLNYENFNKLNNFLFPYNSLISLQYQSSQSDYNTVVTIQHLKAEISDKELKFPFNVPQKYDRK